MERVGILGGTFDPIHNGHLVLAEDARHDLGLDRVLFVVAGDPWQKEGTVVASAFDRLVMADLAIADLSWAEVSTVEIDREGPTYTIDTLEQLHSAQPIAVGDQEFFLILGSDQIDNLKTWHRVKEIPALVTVHPVSRWLKISSTIIRQRVKEGRPIRHLTPGNVIEYISRVGLYVEVPPA